MKLYSSFVLLFFNVSILSVSAQTFEEQMLSRHNYWRNQVNVPPLAWSKTLAQSAEAWGQMIVENSCDLQHSDTPYGENLWMGRGNFSVEEMVDSWTEERIHYNAETNTCASGKSCGHYKQIIWAASKELGCAEVTCDNGWTVIICQFNPPGNYAGVSPFDTSGGRQETLRRDVFQNTESSRGNDSKKTGELTVEEAKDFYHEISQKYCSDAYTIITHDAKEDILYWVDALNEKDLVEDFSTVVHETLHAFDFSLGNFNSSGYFINEGIVIEVPQTEVVNANELNSFIPNEITSKSNRYGLYVGDKSDLSSQVDGIYGLLEEFNGYYHGLKAAFELKKADVPYANNTWISDELESYYEFNLFMARYLQMCQQEYPALYSELINNTPLRVTYTLINQNFAALANAITNHPTIKKNYSTEFKAQLEKQDYAMLNTFSMNGVTKANYEAYLKD